jgi:hypothetical protein
MYQRTRFVLGKQYLPGSQPFVNIKRAGKQWF